MASLVDTNIVLRAAQPTHPMHESAVLAIASLLAKGEKLYLEGIFEIASESLDSYQEWRDLVLANRVTGVKVHDTRLVSLMMVLGITRIITFSMQDFKRFDGIEAIQSG